MKYDIIIVGSGFAGSTIAYKAAKNGKKVLVLEKREHIAGNMYDYIDENGILVQKYGIHSFHTNNENVYEFINEIGDWQEYKLRARVYIDGKYTPSPFNFKTIDDFFEASKAEEIKQHLKNKYPDRNSVTIVELLECDDDVIKSYAEFLFEKDYRPYTSKQWGIKPEELDISVLKRVPVRLDYTDGYFDDKYQLMPKTSFYDIFKNMLSSENIEVVTSCDANEKIKFLENEIYFENEKLDIPLVYTGPIDELFEFEFGKLPYRSLKFDFQTHNVDSYQETSGVVYPMAKDFTRIIEFKKIPIQNIKGVTSIVVEYPVKYADGNEPYYPILTNDSILKYNNYLELSKKYRNLYLCGRLADFKYYNMDNVVERALAVLKDFFNRHSSPLTEKIQLIL